MGKYYRRGHWRRGRNGRRHWVSGHSVRRGRRSRRPRSRTRVRVRVTVRPARPTHQATQRLSDRPNARCPKCGAAVWFYRDRRGGSAYFDAIGHPWPKHPCLITDPEAARAAAKTHQGRQRRPRWRSAPTPPQDTRALNNATAGGPQTRARPNPVPAAQLNSAGRPEPTLPGREPDEAATDKQQSDWLLILSAMIAWVLSLPVSTWTREHTESWMADWVYHWLITTPTWLLLPALIASLWKIPIPKITALDLLAVVMISPLLLGAAIVANIVTFGLALPLTAGGLIYNITLTQKIETPNDDGHKTHTQRT